MNEHEPSQSLPFWLAAGLAVAAGLAGLLAVTGVNLFFLLAGLTAAMQLLLAAGIVISGGGWGYLLIRAILPRPVPKSVAILSACGAGLWLYSTAVMAMGTIGGVLLSGVLWWIVVAAGIVLAAWQSRKALSGMALPRVGMGWLIWLAAALAAGIWLGGATRPAGCWSGLTDCYDVLEYHLQVPREFLEAGAIGALPHNCYSFYPGGTEMLFLLSMILQGGAYDGAYLACILHGVMGVLAVAALWATLKEDNTTRARLAAVLLATTPLVLQLSWLAMVELGELFYLAMAILWLRRWLVDRTTHPALLVGLALGASCCVKYLSVGLIAIPVGLAMVVFTIRRPRQWPQIAAATLIGAIAFSPWLIRNAVYTRDPVFPLATKIFGRGYWTPQLEQRFLAGHGVANLPPVPVPPQWRSAHSPEPSLQQVYHHFLANPQMGVLTILLAACAIVAMALRRRKSWEWSLVVILASQVAIWAFFTHDRPDRFLLPALVPLAMLAAGVVSVGDSFAKARSLLRTAGITLVLLAAGVNLWISYRTYGHYAGDLPGFHGLPHSEIAIANPLMGDLLQSNPAPKILLVGEARAFYFPPGTVYATAFDPQPLSQLARENRGGHAMMNELRRRGITHIWVNWSEIWRLAASYGFDAELSGDLWLRAQALRSPGLPVLDQLLQAGLREWGSAYGGGRQAKTAATMPALTSPPGDWTPANFPGAWPIISVYELPQTVRSSEKETGK